MKYKVGSIVYCKIQGSSIVTANDDSFDAQLPFTIIGEYRNQYIIKIPSYYNILASWRINEDRIDQYGLDPLHLDDRGYLITDSFVVMNKVSGGSFDDGLFCIRCKEFFPMAVGNQPDGTLKCYSCRS